MKSDSIVIIPTYNEEENIQAMLDAVFSLPKAYDVLIIDDNSKDDTANIVKQNIKNRYSQRLFILERSGKLGLGTAYILGFKWALQNEYQYIFEMDCDFSHNPNDLTRLYEACAKDGADLSVGSRYTKGGAIINWTFDRKFISKFASYYVRLITGIPVKDSTAGFVCFKRKVLETLDLNKIQFVGYAFQIEMKYKAWKEKFKIKEVPITFTDRILGQSKMHGGIISEAAWGVIKLRLM